jgi:hypothetical protein
MTLTDDKKGLSHQINNLEKEAAGLRKEIRDR